MKHLNKIFAGAAVLVLLTGCDLFKHSISHDDYQKKVDKLEKHQYAEANVRVKRDVTGTGMYAETAANTDDNGLFVWSEVGGWLAQDGADPLLAFSIVCLQGKQIEEFYGKPDGDNLECKVTYYSNLELKTEITGLKTVETSDWTMNIRYTKYVTTYKFDKYGWLTRSEMICESETTYTEGGTTQRGTQKDSSITEISYK